MDRQLHTKLRKENGFTLIEVLVTLTAFSILMMVSFPSWSGALEGAGEMLSEDRGAQQEAKVAAFHQTVEDAERMADLQAGPREPQKIVTPIITIPCPEDLVVSAAGSQNSAAQSEGGTK